MRQPTSNWDFPEHVGTLIDEAERARVTHLEHLHLRIATWNKLRDQVKALAAHYGQNGIVFSSMSILGDFDTPELEITEQSIYNGGYRYTPGGTAHIERLCCSTMAQSITSVQEAAKEIATNLGQLIAKRDLAKEKEKEDMS